MVGVRGEPVILILVAAIDLQQITATDIGRHFLLRRSMQFKAVLIGFRHGLYGIISISAAITIIIAIIITICIVIAVSIAVVITIAVTIDIVIVFSAVLFNVFLRKQSLTLTCLFPGQLFIFLFQISNSHAPALCIGPLGEQIKPMIGAVKIDIDKRRLGRGRHFQLL